MSKDRRETLSGFSSIDGGTEFTFSAAECTACLWFRLTGNSSTSKGEAVAGDKRTILKISGVRGIMEGSKNVGVDCRKGVKRRVWC